MSEAVTRPALRYFGGKWRIAPWIIGNLPPHDCYVEPFCGAASVLLRKPPSRIEVINDLDGEIVNFFRVLRERPDELVRLIGLTPFSRSEYALAYEPCAASDVLERARRLYVRSWQGRGGGRTQWRSGWRFIKTWNRGTNYSTDWDRVDHLYAIAKRLKHPQIECSDWRVVIRRYDAPGTLFFCDPPYLPDVRSERWRTKAYQCEMGADDHADLVAVLSGIRGMAALCGYASPLYEERLAGWRMLTIKSLTDAGKPAAECLWLSPAAANALEGRMF